jgi:hypothetical protein
MRTIACCLTLALLGSMATAQDTEPKPRISNKSLTAEQIAVYRRALADYRQGSHDALNVANKTEPLEMSGPFWDKHCVKSILFESRPRSGFVVHRFDPASPLGPNAVFVDPEQQAKTVRQNDPGNLIKSAIDDGKKVSESQLDDAVEKAFQTGLFTFSEIAFDKQHHRAVLSYSFSCGGLCGHGNTVVLTKIGDKWKTTKTCSGWIS